MARPLSAQTLSWNIITLDNGGGTAQVGFFTSLDLDGTGKPWVSYYDQTNGALKLTRFNGVSWVTETVDSGGGLGVGRGTSLKLDANGNPHISYVDTVSSALKYASFNGVTWNIQTVASNTYDQRTSLVLNSSGNPLISYWDTGTDDPRVASFNGVSWTVQTVDSSALFFGDTSLVLDSSDVPHIAYQGSQKFASFNGVTWTPQTVDADSSAGYYTSLVLDSTDNPHIAYQNLSLPHTLKYALYDSGSWTIQTVDGGAQSAGAFLSLSLDPATDRPRIAYQNESTGYLMYASFNGVSWSKHVVDTGTYAFVPLTGYYNSLLIDSFGNPHLSYQQSGSTLELRYASLNTFNSNAFTLSSPTALPGNLYNSATYDLDGNFLSITGIFENYGSLIVGIGTIGGSGVVNNQTIGVIALFGGGINTPVDNFGSLTVSINAFVREIKNYGSVEVGENSTMTTDGVTNHTFIVLLSNSGLESQGIIVNAGNASATNANVTAVSIFSNTGSLSGSNSNLTVSGLFANAGSAVWNIGSIDADNIENGGGGFLLTDVEVNLPVVGRGGLFTNSGEALVSGSTLTGQYLGNTATMQFENSRVEFLGGFFNTGSFDFIVNDLGTGTKSGYFFNMGTADNSGTWEINNTATNSFIAGTITSLFNAGSLLITASTVTVVDVFSNTGIVSGTNSSLTVAELFNFGGSIEWTGGSVSAQDAENEGGGHFGLVNVEINLSPSGIFTNSGNSVVEMSGGTMSGGSVTNDGSMVFVNADIGNFLNFTNTGSGGVSFIVNDLGTGTKSGYFFNMGTADNSGTWELDNTATNSFIAGTITSLFNAGSLIVNSARVDVTNNWTNSGSVALTHASIRTGGGGGLFTNAMYISTGSSIDSNFTNTGTHELTDNTSITGNYTNAGWTNLGGLDLTLLGSLNANAGDGLTNAVFVSSGTVTLAPTSGEATFTNTVTQTAGLGGFYDTRSVTFNMENGTINFEVTSTDMGSGAFSQLTNGYALGTITIPNTLTLLRLLDDIINQGGGTQEAIYVENLQLGSALTASNFDFGGSSLKIYYNHIVGDGGGDFVGTYDGASRVTYFGNIIPLSSPSVGVVPEPSTLALLLLGLPVLWFVWKRRKRV